MARWPELEEWMALVDASIEPIAHRPVDLTDPDWERRMREGPDPLDEAGVRPEAESVTRELIGLYEHGDERERAAVRALLDRHPSFRWAAGPPLEPTAEGFRRCLLWMSAVDQGSDTRDELLTLWDYRAKARAAGVDPRPVLLEVAELSSAEDRFGMGSMRDILRDAAGE
ncbi:hypothetical protein ABZT17_23650 [Streptomyces sp. NPDC005648]|uniref:hypothetical protein n=1 Tax=Streptomyces sp. NPDC005648 TaxID=3157044 RepID=UPI0033BB7CD2